MTKKLFLLLLLMVPLLGISQPFFVKSGPFTGNPAVIAEIKDRATYYADQLTTANLQWVGGSGPVFFRAVNSSSLTYTGTENGAPFLLFGDRNGIVTPAPRPWATGQWVLTVTRGANTSTFTFWIVDRVIPDVPEPPKPPVVKPPLQWQWQTPLQFGAGMVGPADTGTFILIRGVDTVKYSWPSAGVVVPEDTAGPTDPILPPVVVPVGPFTYADRNGLILPLLPEIGAKIPDLKTWNVIDCDGSHAGTLAAVARARTTPGPDVIQLPKGSFTWNATIPVDFDGVLIRGWEGNTTLIQITRLNAREGAFTFFGAGLATTRQVINGVTAVGSDTVRIAGSELTKHRTFYQVGKFVTITVIAAPDSLAGTFRTRDIYARVIYRIEEVNAVAGFIRVDTRLATELRPENVHVQPTGVIQNVGVENLTIQFNPNMGGTWSHGLWFGRVYNGWARNLQIIAPPSFAWNVDYCKYLTVSDVVTRDAQNQGGGGNGYVGLTACSHCEVRNVDAKNFRHLTMQSHVEFSEISDSRFEGFDLHLHNSWVRYSGFNRVEVFKDRNGKPLAIQLPHPDNTIHAPIGEYCYLMNSTVRGGEFGRLFEIGHAKGFVLAYNTLSNWNFENNRNRRAMFSVWDHSHLTIYGNQISHVPNPKVDASSVFLLTVYPAYRAGVQTGVGFYPALTPWTYGATVPAEKPKIYFRFENNTITGIPEAQKWPAWNIQNPDVFTGNIWK